MKFNRKLIATAALAALPFAALAQSTGNTYDRENSQQQNSAQTAPSGSLNGPAAPRNVYRITSGFGGGSAGSGSTTLSNPSSTGSQNFTAPGRLGQAQNSGQPGNRDEGRNDYRNGGANRADERGRDARGWNERREEGRQAYGERREEQGRRGGEYREGNRDRREDRAERENRRDYREHRAERYEHQRDNRQAWNNRREGGYRQPSSYQHDGGFRGGQQAHSFQQPSFQQHSFQQHSFAQAGGGRRSR